MRDIGRVRVSVITPTLNMIRWIAACVENVAAQGDAVLEHIVVDGGSSDGTTECVRALARIHPRLTLLVAPGCNQSAAMNIGTEAASGAAIGILNADDFYEPGAVRSATTMLRRAAAPTLVAGDCLVIGPDDRTAWNRPRDLRLESLLLGWEATQFPCNSSAYFYHRELHGLTGGYDVGDDFTMDLDFLLGCAAVGELRYEPAHWGNYRLWPGTKTYEDPHGDARRAAVIARHQARLEPHRRALMERIARGKQDRPNENAPQRRITRSDRGITLTRPPA